MTLHKEIPCSNHRGLPVADETSSRGGSTSRLPKFLVRDKNDGDDVSRKIRRVMLYICETRKRENEGEKEGSKRGRMKLAVGPSSPEFYLKTSSG